MKKFYSISLVLLTTFQVFSQDYQSLHNLLIKFYGYQRAGLKSGDCYNLNPGFQAGYHKNDNYNGKQLDAGWYDAGDYIKFGMNLGYAVYCLLKGYDLFPSAYDDKYKWDHSSGADNIPDILNQVKYATDYLIKAVIDDNTIVLDVGKAQDEHGALDAPIPFSDGRSGSQILLCNGADIPLTYAACLALMSTLYRQFDASYADQCLEKAKTAFKFGKKKCDQGGDNNLFCTPQLKNGEPLYDYPKDENTHQYILRSVNDRMVAAGVELYRATNDEDPVYKQYAQKTIVGVTNCMGYSSIGPLASFETWRQGLTTSAGALANNVGFLETKIKTEGKFKGVYQNSGWGTARDIGTAAFEFAMAYITSSTDNARTKYLDLVKKHIDWVAFGSQSYIVGFGKNPPNSIHYRPTRSGPPGGLVSGPDGDGNWVNDASQAQYTEVAIDYNAGIIGAVAFMRAYENPGDAIKLSKAFTANKTTDIDFNSGDVTLSASFSKSIPWTIKIIGSFGEKTFSGTGNSISQKWDGSADKGMFLGGEVVKAKLILEGTEIAIYDLQKTMPIGLEIANVKKASSSSSDVSIDDFEDSNLNNKIGGSWVANGTGSGLSATRISVAEDDGSKALAVTLNCVDDGYKTFSGVRTTFNSSGSAISIGSSKSIVFDLKANDAFYVYVELEQSNITDSAYYGTVIPVTKSSNRYRLQISKFKQPDWKKNDVTMDLSKITALRFTVYDSIGQKKIYLDNVAIEDFSTSTIFLAKSVQTSAFKPVFYKGSLMYSIPQGINGALKVSIYDISGKLVMNRVQNVKAGSTSLISFSRIPDGIYTVVNTMNGKVYGEKLKITNVK